MTTPTRCSCYTHLYLKAAEVLGLEDCRNPDDVFKAIIKGQRVNDLVMARKLINDVLDQYNKEHG